jgi:Na+-driven multidrug efflux pump
MGPYFDALLGGSSFKTASDGSRLFFPWGGLGRGYVIASERDYQRLRRQIKIYFTVFYVFIFGAIWLPTYFIGVGKTNVALGVIAVALIGFYGLWAWSLCQRLQPSNETLSGRKVSTQHASAVLLLLMTLVFVFGAVWWASSVLPS